MFKLNIKKDERRVVREKGQGREEEKDKLTDMVKMRTCNAERNAKSIRVRVRSSCL